MLKFYQKISFLKKGEYFDFYSIEIDKYLSCLKNTFKDIDTFIQNNKMIIKQN